MDRNVGWWITTALAIVSAVTGPLAANCAFGPQVCNVIVAVDSAIVLLLGVTHSGAGMMPFPRLVSSPPVAPLLALLWLSAATVWAVGLG